MTNKDYIDAALYCDIDLPAADYSAKQAAADKATEAHGIEGKAPISEAVRHKRIQSNYYGTSLNVMLSLLAEVSCTNELLRQLITMIGSDHGKQ